LTAATQYTYRVRTEGAGILTDYSNTAVVTTPQVQNLTSVDINASQTGSTTVVNPGTDYDVTAGGPAIYNTADGFRFLYLQQTGNFDVKVRINSISFAGGIDQAGLMARTSLDPSSPEVSVTASPSNGYRFKYRTTQAGATNSLTTSAPTNYPNVWLRLQRAGTLFTGYFSSDGVNWTSAGSITVALSDPLYLGLASAANVTTSTINVQLPFLPGRNLRPHRSRTVKPNRPDRNRQHAHPDRPRLDRLHRHRHRVSHRAQRRRHQLQRDRHQRHQRLHR